MTNSENIKKEIGLRIKKLCEDLGITQEQLARKVGYTSSSSRSTINKVELGKSDIPQSKLVAYATALDTSVEYLLGLPTFEILSTNVLNIRHNTGENTVEIDNLDDVITIVHNGVLISKHLSPNDAEMMVRLIERLPDVNENTIFNPPDNSKRLAISPEEQK